jgi:hypothetical protein
MPKWKEGDRVRVKNRPVTEEDRRTNRYYEHMAGLVGSVQNVYSDEEVAIRVDPDSLSDVTRDVHATATQRMRDKFLNAISEEQRKQLTKEELNFDANYVLLVRTQDLEGV